MLLLEAADFLLLLLLCWALCVLKVNLKHSYGLEFGKTYYIAQHFEAVTCIGFQEHVKQQQTAHIEAAYCPLLLQLQAWTELFRNNVSY